MCWSRVLLGFDDSSLTWSLEESMKALALADISWSQWWCKARVDSMIIDFMSHRFHGCRATVGQGSYSFNNGRSRDWKSNRRPMEWKNIESSLGLAWSINKNSLQTQKYQNDIASSKIVTIVNEFSIMDIQKSCTWIFVKICSLKKIVAISCIHKAEDFYFDKQWNKNIVIVPVLVQLIWRHFSVKS